MLVSTNRTVVELVAVEAVAGAEAADLALALLLLSLEPGELCLASGQRAQVLGDERADRGAALGGADPRVAVDVVWHGDRDVLHGPRLAQLHRFCESRNECGGTGEEQLRGPVGFRNPAEYAEQQRPGQGTIGRWPCRSSTSWHCDSSASCSSASKASTPRTLRSRFSATRSKCCAAR